MPFELLSSHPYEFEVQRSLLSFFITLVVTALFLWVAARIVIDRGGLLAALLTALVGSIAANLVLWFVPISWLAFVLALAVWALVAAIFFRTGWLKGAVIGLVAWVLFFVVNLIMNAVL